MSWYFYPSFMTVEENDTWLSFSLRRTSWATAQTVYVSTVQDRGYSNAGDYDGLLNVPVTFASGETSKTVSVRIREDALDEPDESFSLIAQQNASDPTSVYLARAGFTIVDDDVPAATWSWSPASRSVPEDDTTISFTLTRSHGQGSQTVYVSTVQDRGYSNAGDYDGLLNVPVTFASGETSKTVSVRIREDALDEPDESFSLIAQQNASDPTSVYLARAGFTIVDDDVPAATWSWSPASRSVPEDDTTISFTLTRSHGQGSQTVYVSTVQDRGYSNAGDYDGLLNVPVTFASGETSKTVSVRIREDALDEPDESFSLIAQQNASDPTSVYLARAGFTIVDDDVPAATWSWSPASRSVPEDDTTISFTLTRSHGQGSQTVYVSTVQDRGYSNAGDYDGLLNVPVTFASGETSKTVSVRIREDALDEPDESFSLIAQQNASDPTSVYLARAGFTIVDDDEALPLPVVEGPLLSEAAKLALWAYDDQAHVDAGWRPVTADELGINQSFLDWSFDDGVVTTSVDGFHQNLHLYVAELNGEKTLSIAFRGSDEEGEIPYQAAHGWERFYKSFNEFWPYLESFVQTFVPDRVLVAGHSLGGALSQMFLVDKLSQLGMREKSVIVTFGSPGSDSDYADRVLENDRILNVVHNDDIVPIQPRGERRGIDLEVERPESFLNDEIEHSMNLYYYTSETIDHAIVSNKNLSTNKQYEIYSSYAENYYFAVGSAGKHVVWDEAGVTLHPVILIGGDSFETLTGGSKSDIFYGGAGDDTLYGRGGRDSFVFDGDFGHDTVWDATDGEALFLPGLSLADLAPQRDGLDLLLAHGDDSVRVRNAYRADITLLINGESWSSGAEPPPVVPLGDGIDWTGTERADRKTGTNDDDRLDGQGGNDRLRGRGGDDVLIGGPGNDRIYGDAGTDTVVFPGDHDDFRVQNRGKSWLVKDLDRSDGDAGTDRIYSSEILQFDDVRVDITGKTPTVLGPAPSTASSATALDDLLTPADTVV